MSKAWNQLEKELDLWATEKKIAQFWWRDDDAVSFTPQLAQLDELSRTMNVPIAIAVIPKDLDNSLVQFIEDKKHFKVLQHGYAHQSYAGEGQKKIEVGGDRLLEDIQMDLSIGFKRLKAHFNEQFLPVLVPPWNRINPNIYPLLSQNFKGLSSMWARPQAFAAKGLYQVNTHLDPVNWRHGRGFIAEDDAVNLIFEHLVSKRKSGKDTLEPTGLLTHHLAQNEDVWFFCEKFMSRLNQHSAVKWLTANEIWT